jgi:segregation and condensation protein A
MLQQKRMVEDAIWSNPQIEQFLSEEDGPGLAVGLIDLVKTLQTVLERVKARPTYDIGKEDVSVPDMIKLVSYELERMRPSQSLSATRLFERQRSRRAMICLFLAILELVKLQAVDLTQGELFGDIGIRRRENFKQALENAEKLDTVEQDYQ